MNRRAPNTPPEPIDEEILTREDLPFVSRRLAVLFALFAAVLVLFATRVYKLTVLRGPYYQELSERNFIFEQPLPAPRGRILDRSGQPLAVNETLYDLEMSPFYLKRAEIRATVERLARLLGRPELLNQAAVVARLRPAWKSLTLVRNLTMDKVLPVMEQSFELPGVVPRPYFQRYYPQGALTGGVTGHVGNISPAGLDRFLDKGYLRTEKIGCLGAELTFEDVLHGEMGSEIVTRDAHGRVRSHYDDRQAQPGNTLVLTIDLGLQRLADALLGDWKGAIVAMDPRDGAVLAMVGHPTYDPNDPLRGNSYNRVTMSTTAPGSTFKIVTASAGLQAGLSPNYVSDCDGAITISSFRFPCHLKWGHGREDMNDALRDSCNVFFYRWAKEVGASGMIEMARAYGFGQPTGFELVTPAQEVAGKPAGNETPFLGSVLHMGIGQGELIDVTPIQMARAYAALCNGGILYRPRIVKEIRSPAGEPIKVGQAEEQGRLPLSEQNRQFILKGLWDVVHDAPKGTASRTGFKPEWRVAGKTGTAQHGIKGIPSNAWFACFAPADAPEILIIVFVEHAGHGGAVAAPLARQLLAYYYGQPEPQIVPPPHEAPIGGGD
ncbi:MAG: penicillin-binding protein 2 [bacterium]|nr:penicillin-binding protein 2 [bacterium]